MITGHRRENFGEGFINICESISELAKKYKDVHFVYPVHLNPNVQFPVRSILSGIHNIHLINPLKYDIFVYLLRYCYFVLTDSGGIQEEAPSLGKPVLVMRDVTERTEALDAGTVVLIGTNKDSIVNNVSLLLNNIKIYEKIANSNNPYGDGTASDAITLFLKDNLIH